LPLALLERVVLEIQRAGESFDIEANCDRCVFTTHTQFQLDMMPFPRPDGLSTLPIINADGAISGSASGDRGAAGW